MDWKKLAISFIAAVVIFALLWFFGSLISPKFIYAAFAAAIGYLVYAKVAWWEIDKAKHKIKG
jgi:uncharacterized membrane protein